jgi:hypothetical protein
VISLPASNSSPGSNGTRRRPPPSDIARRKPKEPASRGVDGTRRAPVGATGATATRTPATPEPRPSHAADLTYKIAGTIVGTGLAAVTGFWAALLTPLHVTIAGSVLRLPIAPVVALVCNLGIFWMTRIVTGRTGLGVLPAVGWFLVIFAAGRTTSEGDLLITGNNWVGVVTILVGALAWAIGPYFTVIRGGRRPRG